MCVCKYVGMYVGMHVCMYTTVCRPYVCLHAYMYVCTMQTCILCACVRACVCVCTLNTFKQAYLRKELLASLTALQV